MRPFFKSLWRRTSMVALAVGLAHGPVGRSGAQSPERGPNSYELLGRRIQERIDEFQWGGARLSLQVADTEIGLKIFDFNSESAASPGVVMKTLVAAAALDRLGTDFRFTTDLFSTGPVVKRRLEGSLLVRGTGDPSLAAEFGGDFPHLFDQWARELRARKIREVAGPILLDVSAFDAELLAPTWPLDRLGGPRIVAVDALNLNGNCIEVRWQRGKKEGRAARYTLFPPVDDLVVVSHSVRLRTLELAGRIYYRAPDSNVIRVQGDLGVRSSPVDRASVPRPALLFGQTLKWRLAEAGVRVQGEVELIESPDDPRLDPDSLERIAGSFSPPLGEIVRNMMNSSSNLGADALLKSLGRRRADRLGSFSAGADEVRDFMASVGVNPSGLVMLDGSGLSRLNRLSGRQVMGVMAVMSRHRTRRAFAAGFPAVRPRTGLSVSAGSGDELGSAGPPSVHAITGRGPDGFSTAGWAVTRAGRPLHFVFFATGSSLKVDLLETQFDSVIAEIGRSWIQ